MRFCLYQEVQVPASRPSSITFILRLLNQLLIPQPLFPSIEIHAFQPVPWPFNPLALVSKEGESDFSACANAVSVAEEIVGFERPPFDSYRVVEGNEKERRLLGDLGETREYFGHRRRRF